MRLKSRDRVARGVAAAIIALFALAVPVAAAIVEGLERPGDREFIADTIDLIRPADEVEIRAIADKLLTDTRSPIIVVTIRELGLHGGGSLSIETFARVLFDEWGIGVLPENRGILLLVSLNDRKARIEFGAGFAHQKDAKARQIMDDVIIAHFKDGEFSAGILEGVRALDLVARDQALPEPPPFEVPVWVWLVTGGLGVFTVVSLVRSGTIGWGWLLWAAVFGFIFLILRWFFSGSGDGSGGGYGGGSFGGGFSGGGGASGSW